MNLQKIKNHPDLPNLIGLFIITLLMLIGALFNPLPAQQPDTDFQINLKDGKVKAGQFVTNGTFTLRFGFTSDSTTDRNRSARLWTYGSSSASISYEKDDALIQFTTNGITNTIYSFRAYEMITDRKPHTLLFSYNGNTAYFCLDKYLVDSAKIPGKPAPINAPLYLSSDPITVDSIAGGRIIKRDIVYMDCASGRFTQLSLLQGGTDLTHYIPLPALPLDSNDYPVNFNTATGDLSKCRKALDQFKIFPAPNFRTAKGPQLGSSVNFAYLAEQSQPGVSSAQMQATRKELTDIYCSKFNGTIRIDNLGQFYSSPKSYQDLIDLHFQHPEYPVDITTQLAQLNPVDSRKLLTKTQIDALMPNCDNTVFEVERYVLQKYAEQAQRTFSVARFHWENDEFITNFPDTVRYQKDAGCRAAKEAAGLTWKQYCSKRHAEVLQYIIGGIRIIYPGVISNRYLIFYSTNYQGNALLEFDIYINSDTCASPNAYPEKPEREKTGNGNQTGIGNYYDSKYREIQLGHQFNNPYVAAGWNADPRKNLSPAQLSGLWVMVYGGGVKIPIPAYFTLTGYGITGFQPTAGYAFQTVMPAYIEAAISTPDLNNLYYNSELMPGDQQDQYYRVTNQPVKLNGRYWSGYKNVLTAVRKGKSRTHEFLIFTTVIKPNNTTDPYGYSRSASIHLNGADIQVTATVAGKIYKYDDRLPVSASNPRVIFSGKRKHPDRLVN